MRHGISEVRTKQFSIRYLYYNSEDGMVIY